MSHIEIPLHPISDIDRLKVVVMSQYPPVNKVLLQQWHDEATLPELKNAITEWMEVLDKKRVHVTEKTFDQAMAVINGENRVGAFADGGTVGSVTNYFKSLDLHNLPVQVQAYIREQIINDAAAGSFDETNETFLSVKEIIDRINQEAETKFEREEAEREAIEFAENNPPVNLDAEPEIPATEEQVKEPVISERQVIINTIADAEASLEFLKGKEKKEVKEYIAGLKSALEFLPEEKAEGGGLTNVWSFVEKYYPNYYGSDDIAYNEDLHKIVDQEEQDGDDAAELLKDEFNGDRIKAAKAMRESDASIYQQAIQGFIDQTGKVATVDEFVKEYNNGHPEIQEPHFMYENAIANYIYRHPEEEFKSGGRLKSALMRDRKYTSQQEWEKNYHRESRRHFYKKQGGSFQQTQQNSGLYPTTYEGKKANEVWDIFSESQRLHFLHDHAPDLPIAEKEAIVSTEWSKLDKKIKQLVSLHVYMGRYEEGGALNAQQEQLLNDLAADFKPEVEKIERKFATTQNHYGDYMALLSSMNKPEKITKILALALIRAGANKQGVISALRVLYGAYEQGGSFDDNLLAAGGLVNGVDVRSELKNRKQVIAQMPLHQKTIYENELATLKEKVDLTDQQVADIINNEFSGYLNSKHKALRATDITKAHFDLAYIIYAMNNAMKLTEFFGDEYALGGSMADLKRKLQLGTPVKMIYFYGQREPNERNKMLGVTRYVVKVQSNAVAFNPDKNAKTGSFWEFPPASLVEMTANGFKVYDPAYRDLTPDEQRVYDARPIDRKQSEMDAMTDSSTMYYIEKNYFENSPYPYLFGTEEVRGKYYDSNKGKVRDKSIKGELALEYEFVDQKKVGGGLSSTAGYEATLYFKDEPNNKISGYLFKEGDTEDDGDENIFFYVDSEAEMKRLMNPDNGEDFVVVSYEPTKLLQKGGGLKGLDAEMKKHGYENIATGGGCDAYEKKLDKGFYVLITNEGDPSVPEKMDDDVTIGLYEEDGSPIDYTSMKLSEFLANEAKELKELSEQPEAGTIPGLTGYDKWEDKVTSFIEDMCGVTRSDAQGIVMAQPFYMQQSWTKGMTAKETAKLIDEKSLVKAKGGGLKGLDAEMKKHGYENIATGGGCDAYFKKTKFGDVTITDGEANVPQSMNEEALVSLYEPGKSNEIPGIGFKRITVKEFLKDEAKVLKEIYAKPYEGFHVMNRTDGFPASPEVYATKEEAQKFIDDFPKRFAQQGYYLTSRRERIAPEDVVLEIMPVGGFENGGGLGKSKKETSTEKTREVMALKEITDTTGDTKTKYPSGTIFKLVADQLSDTTPIIQHGTDTPIGVYWDEIADVITYKDKKYPVRKIWVKKDGATTEEVTVANNSLRDEFKKARWRGKAKTIDDTINFYVPDKLLAEKTEEELAKHLFGNDISVVDKMKSGGTVAKMPKEKIRKAKTYGPHILKPAKFDIGISKKLAQTLLLKDNTIIDEVSIMCKELGNDGIWGEVKKSDLVNYNLPSKYKTFELWITTDKQECEKQLNDFINKHKLQ